MDKVKRLIENHIIFKTNIEEEVFNIKNSVIDNILKERNLFIKNNTGEYRNFTLKKTIYTNKLYNIFKTIVKKTFKKVTPLKTLSTNNCYAYVSDKSYSVANWHDHKTSSSITGVFYLKTVKTRGIEFKYPEKNSIYFEPKDYDFIMFPGDLPHYPYPSLDNKIRISINMEIACKESISEIFNINNIKIDNINTKKRLYKRL